MYFLPAICAIVLLLDRDLDVCSAVSVAGLDLPLPDPSPCSGAVVAAALLVVELMNFDVNNFFVSAPKRRDTVLGTGYVHHCMHTKFKGHVHTHARGTMC